MAKSLRPSSDPEEAKFVQRLVEKLKYCKEVLVSIRNASSNSGGPGSIDETGTLAVPGAAPSVSSKSSKISLR